VPQVEINASDANTRAARFIAEFPSAAPLQ